jgi:uncharacterized protein YgiM (DUF1202 family)
VACVARGELRSSPGGGVAGSISAGEPLHVVGRRGAWPEVATQFGATGWVPARDLCG